MVILLYYCYLFIGVINEKLMIIIMANLFPQKNLNIYHS